MDKIKTNFEGQIVYSGMDIHKGSWNLGIFLNDMYVKNVHQKPNPTIMFNYLKQHYPGGRYIATYEAGKFGFWIQRQLTALGIECLVVITAGSEWTQQMTTTTRFTFKNLTTAQKYWCRMAAIGPYGQVVYSDAVSRVVQ